MSILSAWLEDSPNPTKLAEIILLVVTDLQNDLNIKTVFKSNPEIRVFSIFFFKSIEEKSNFGHSVGFF